VQGPAAANEELKALASLAAAQPPPARSAASASPPGPTTDPCGGAFSVSLSSRAAVPLWAAEERSLKPRDVFKECEHCSEMVVVPAGRFTVGSPKTEKAAQPTFSVGPRVKLKPNNRTPFRTGRGLTYRCIVKARIGAKTTRTTLIRTRDFRSRLASDLSTTNILPPNSGDATPKHSPTTVSGTNRRKSLGQSRVGATQASLSGRPSSKPALQEPTTIKLMIEQPAKGERTPGSSLGRSSVLDPAETAAEIKRLQTPPPRSASPVRLSQGHSRKPGLRARAIACD
jgi:hypothetical protein